MIKGCLKIGCQCDGSTECETGTHCDYLSPGTLQQDSNPLGLFNSMFHTTWGDSRTKYCMPGESIWEKVFAEVEAVAAVVVLVVAGIGTIIATDGAASGGVIAGEEALVDAGLEGGLGSLTDIADDAMFEELDVEEDAEEMGELDEAKQDKTTITWSNGARTFFRSVKTGKTWMTQGGTWFSVQT